MKPAFIAALSSAAAVVYPAKTATINEPFTRADATQMYAVSGWTAWDSAGVTTNAARANFQVQGNQARWTASDFGAGPGNVIVGADSGSSDHVFRMTVAVVPPSGGFISMVCAITNQANCVYMEIASQGTTANSMTLKKRVAGVDTQIASSASISTDLGRAIQAGDVIEIAKVGNSINVYCNGVSWKTGADCTGVGSGQGCGTGARATGGGGTNRVDDFYIAPLAGMVTPGTTPVFIPGIVGAGTTRAFSGTYAGTVSDIDYRVLNASTRVEVQTWRRSMSKTIGGGTWTCSDVSLPMSDNTTNPQYIVEFRAANDTDAHATTTAAAVGIAIAGYGQSNSDFRATAGSPATSYTSSTNVYSYSPTRIGANWARSGATTTEALHALGVSLASRSGIPVGVINYGVGSQFIDSLLDPSGPGYWDEMAGYVSAVGATGKVSAWLWTQGEAEAENNSLNTYTAYKTKFASLASQMRALSVSTASPILLAVIGRKNGGPANGGAAIASANWSGMRQTHYELSTETANTGIGGVLIDLDMTGSSLHYTSNSYVEMNRRASAAIAAALGFGGYDGRGPFLTTASRSGAVITMPITLNGAASISGTGLTYFDVSSDDFATTKTVSSVNISGGDLVITLASDPGTAVKVRSHYGYDFPTPTWAYGSYSDGTTMPLLPIFAPITAA